MTGTVKKRGRVFWLDAWINGKRERVSLRTRDRATADQRAAEYVAAARTVRPVTLADDFKVWFRDYVTSRRTEAGQAGATGRFRKHIAPAFGTMTAESIRPADLWEFRGKLDLSLKPATVRMVLTDLKCLLGFIGESRPVIRWPRRLMPKLAERLPDRLTDGQVAALLADPDPDTRWTVAFLLSTGLRKSELDRLTWGAVRDLPFAHLVLDETKSGKVRRVPLSDPAKSLLAERRGQDFPAPIRGRRLTDLCPGKGWHLHQLRHTFACRFIESGGSLPALQQILGHGSIVMTQRYARLDDAAVHRAVTVVDTVRMGEAASK